LRPTSRGRDRPSASAPAAAAIHESSQAIPGLGGQLEPVKVYKQTKYTSNNRVVQYLNRVYLRNITALVLRARPRRLLDVGCGEGVVLRHLDRHLEGVTVVGLDVDGTGLRVARSQNAVSLVQGSVYDLPFAAGSFDLVLCCEVLEHVERPDAALAELARVSRDRVLLSVPNEPIWCLSNMARGKYLARFGNTIGHIQHWTRWAFLRFVRTRLDLVEVRTWLPFWSMMLSKVRRHPGESGF
jgi:ubiquinone/menaquinone biosynthesis C-methylase UbiE